MGRKPYRPVHARLFLVLSITSAIPTLHPSSAGRSKRAAPSRRKLSLYKLQVKNGEIFVPGTEIWPVLCATLAPHVEVNFSAAGRYFACSTTYPEPAGRPSTRIVGPQRYKCIAACFGYSPTSRLARTRPVSYRPGRKSRHPVRRGPHWGPPSAQSGRIASAGRPRREDRQLEVAIRIRNDTLRVRSHHIGRCHSPIPRQAAAARLRETGQPWTRTSSPHPPAGR